MKNDEFYVGYLEDMPPSFRKRMKQSVLVLLAVLPVLGTVLVMGQRGFSMGKYELGKLTRIQGVAFEQPVPSIKIWLNTPGRGTQLQTLVLMSFGKFGAEADLEKIAARVHAQTGKGLSEVLLTLEGTLDYRDGRCLFELTNKEESLVDIAEIPEGSPFTTAEVALERYGRISLSGEIVDSKCFFGTMKPGFGKPHRSCAIRCVSGGIPPVLVARAESGATATYLLRGPNGGAINEAVLPFIADAVKVKGELLRYDDWYVLLLDPGSDIQRIDSQN